jgi:hypothetical protein
MHDVESLYIREELIGSCWWYKTFARNNVKDRFQLADSVA